MSKFPGYSKISNPTDEEIVDLNYQLMSGHLSRLFLHEGTAYYRRASAREQAARRFQPGPGAPVSSTDHKVAASLEPDYSSENLADKVDMVWHIRLYAAAVATGAILAILYHAWGQP